MESVGFLVFSFCCSAHLRWAAETGIVLPVDEKAWAKKPCAPPKKHRHETTADPYGMTTKKAKAKFGGYILARRGCMGSVWGCIAGSESTMYFFRSSWWRQ
jgi:hypothetical protein